MINSLHFRSFIKFLGRNRLYTAINVFGLSISLMFVILIAVYTVQELSVDKLHVNRKRIYAIGSEEIMGSAYGLAPYLLDRYPEIEKITGVLSERAPVEVTGARHNADILLVDTTFYDIFSFRMIEGDAAAILRSKTEVIVSENFARKAFGNNDPIGQTIRIDSNIWMKDRPTPPSLVIAGIAKSFGNASLSETDIIMNLELEEVYFNSSISNHSLSNVGSVALFIMTYPEADFVSKIPDMEEWFKEFFWVYQKGWENKVTLTNLDDFYFAKTEDPGYFRRGNSTLVMVLISIAALILIFAIINYINLTVAQTGFRAKEMASRRLLGASRGEIFVKFILESILVCAFAFVVGFLLAAAFQNAAGDLLGRRLDVEGSVTWPAIGVCAVLVFVMGVVSGIIPAVFISRYKPIDVVKGSFRLRSKMVFSKVFMVFQNVITISLIAASLTILLQIRHMMEAPTGYNTENIINIDAGGLHRNNIISVIGNELKKLPSVKDVSLAQGTPAISGNNNTTDYNGKEISYEFFKADSAFFRMMGFEILKNNHLVTADGYWISESAKNQMELGDDDMEFKYEQEMVPILGIVRDFRVGSSVLNAHDDPALLIHIYPDNIKFDPWDILVQVQGDPDAAFADVQEVYERLTGIEFEGRYVKDIIKGDFNMQRQLYIIVTIFTFVAILISALGLLAMSTYFIQQRASEIAIRKVFGSTRGEVLRRLILNYLQLVAIAFLLAVPVIWLAMRRWLSDYSYRITLSPWIFIAAGGFALLIAFMTVLWQSSRAANANPTDSIKN